MPFGRKSTNRIVPASTTPTLDYGARPRLWFTLTKVLLAVAIPLGLLLWKGQPVLRINYTYTPASSPFSTTKDRNYQRCTYLSLLNGWHEYHPGPGINQCPILITLPVSLSDLNPLKGE